jgi:hypothetical protein
MALLGQLAGVLAEAQLAILRFTRIVAALEERARLAGAEVVERALGARVEVVEVTGDLAATEAITAVRHQRHADIETVRRHLQLAHRVLRIIFAANLSAGVLGVALEVPLAVVVALAGVVVEEAVRLAVFTATGDIGLEAGLAVVTGAGALGIVGVDLAVAVVVETVAADPDPVTTGEDLALDRAPVGAAVAGHEVAVIAGLAEVDDPVSALTGARFAGLAITVAITIAGLGLGIAGLGIAGLGLAGVRNFNSGGLELVTLVDGRLQTRTGAEQQQRGRGTEQGRNSGGDCDAV